MPVSITNASRLSTLTLTITFNPRAARAQRAGRHVHAPGRRRRRRSRSRSTRPAGRIDIAITRPGDQAGASGTGLLAALLFDAVGPGSSTFRSAASEHAGGRPVAAAVQPGDGHGALGAGRRRLIAESRERTQTLRVDRDVAAVRQRGFTFIELLVVTTILLILASAVMPLAQVTMQRQREAELRRVLREMRTAIDKFKDAADAGAIPPTELKAGSEGYPPDLETLVEGVTVANDATGRKLKFLRRVPIDPMTAPTNGACARIRTSPIRRRGAGRTSSTCARSRRHGARRHEIQGLVGWNDRLAASRRQ